MPPKPRLRLPRITPPRIDGRRLLRKVAIHVRELLEHFTTRRVAVLTALIDAFLTPLLVLLPLALGDWTLVACWGGRHSKRGGMRVQPVERIAEELKTQDAPLNAAYQRLRSRLSAERKKTLLTAQRLWIR